MPLILAGTKALLLCFRVFASLAGMPLLARLSIRVYVHAFMPCLLCCLVVLPLPSVATPSLSFLLILKKNCPTGRYCCDAHTATKDLFETNLSRISCAHEEDHTGTAALPSNLRPILLSSTLFKDLSCLCKTKEPLRYTRIATGIKIIRLRH